MAACIVVEWLLEIAPQWCQRGVVEVPLLAETSYTVDLNGQLAINIIDLC